jgi:MoaA/NifB/PqqE/SkfB family radical SAM enzyme
MTVVMKDNQDELAALFEQSAAAGVGHQITLLSTHGFRRGGPKAGPQSPSLDGIDALPDLGVGAELASLWQRYPHARFFRDYALGIDAFVQGGGTCGDRAGDRAGAAPLPDCHAGEQSFNIDHVGNVAPCIEKIDLSVGNVRNEALAELLARLKSRQAGRGCQDCWTACRGFVQALGEGGTRRGWQDMSKRMRSW